MKRHMKRWEWLVSALVLLVLVAVVSPAVALEEPDRLYLVGERAVADGLHALAARVLERFVSDYPNDARVPTATLLLGRAWLEPGALDAVIGARAAGCGVALWTNNAREVTAAALGRFDLLPHFDLVVTRDEMGGLKPAPDGWSVIAPHFGVPESEAVVVGDSWVDGLAAAKAGVPFVAYRAKLADLERWGIQPIAHVTDLATLPAWLTARSGRAGP